MQYSFEDVQISIPQSDCFIKNKGKLTREAARKVNVWFHTATEPQIYLASIRRHLSIVAIICMHMTVNTNAILYILLNHSIKGALFCKLR